jgi:small subunit ribosomal protein S16
MAVALRLMRFGKKGQPSYRIVAIDKRKPRNSSYIENIGTFNPFATEKEALISASRLKYWTEKGAQISEGLEKLLKSKKKVVFTD